jgi:hypothetical protein
MSCHPPFENFACISIIKLLNAKILMENLRHTESELINNEKIKESFLHILASKLENTLFYHKEVQ